MEKDEIKIYEILKNHPDLSRKDIIEQFNLSRDIMYEVIKKNPELKRLTSISQEEIDIALFHFNEGATNKEISKILNRSVDSVGDLFKKLNLSLSHRKRYVPYNPFENITNPHVQYWLGILATDGCVHGDRISISQCTKNIDIILKFQKFLNSSVNIRDCIHIKPDGEYMQHHISFRNENICKFLEKIGITERKTDTLKVSFPLTFDFLRGVIDGDGAIIPTTNAIRIASNSKDFTYQISDFLNGYNIKHSIYKYDNKPYDLQIVELLSVFRLINFLYYDGCTYLDRKYNNAQYIRNYIHKRFKFRELSSENPERNQ